MTGTQKTRKGLAERLRTLLRAGAERSRRRAASPVPEAAHDLEQEHVLHTVSRLAGGVAHDLNNILLVVQGYTEMALGEEDAGPAVKALLGEVKEATTRAARLIRELLIVGQRGPFTPRLLDLDETVRLALPQVQDACGPSIQVIHEPHARQPQILADEELMSKLLISLAARAREAMPLGGTFTVAVSHEGEGPGRMVLSAVDTGEALSEEDRAIVFEPYLPGRTGGKGRGLGLSLVYAIAQRCAASVSVESHTGTGTEFRVSFPVREAAPLSPAVSQSTPSMTRTASADPVPTAGVSILIAEDDDGLRALATKILAREGYVVLAARDGEEAVELFEREREHVRLVVLDDVMPRMGGRAALARIRQSATNLPAILCSGYTWSLDGQNQEIGGFSSILPKPWQPRELLRSVREGLESAR